MKKKCPNNERNNPQGAEGIQGEASAPETPVKKPVAKSKLVNAAINKKVEAIKEEDEDGGGHDGVGDSQVLPKRNEPSKPKEYIEPQHSRTESAMKRDNEVLDKLDAELKTQEQNLNSKKVK
jgi:hypothetical protein